ncbi:hypothetical protein [Hyalangium minutum]|uniref:Uncharacterized protein n=1 Tax=Hyalangium minutum TaxID=394096 RepID=A0A085WCQ0_9BACT|nr:hypothetical protein [Hyalangium minutum]KFE65463.1 hypothetical protein DB31_1579 [Hyalangium minutum]
MSEKNDKTKDTPELRVVHGQGKTKRRAYEPTPAEARKKTKESLKEAAQALAHLSKAMGHANKAYEELAAFTRALPSGLEGKPGRRPTTFALEAVAAMLKARARLSEASDVTREAADELSARLEGQERDDD